MTALFKGNMEIYDTQGVPSLGSGPQQSIASIIDSTNSRLNIEEEKINEFNNLEIELST